MTQPGVLRARLTELQDRLTKPTPAPLEGQQALDLPEGPDGPNGGVRRPSPPPNRPARR